MTHITEARLLRYVLDELDGDARLAVDSHLQVCAHCRRRLALERDLDECVLATAASPSSGSAERALERLWERVDGRQVDGRQRPGWEAAPAPVSADSPPASGGALRRAATWLVVAAAGLLALLWLRGQPDADGLQRVQQLLVSTDSQPTEGRPPPWEPGSQAESTGTLPLPHVAAPGQQQDQQDVVDLVRLQAVRDEVAAALLAADERFPILQAAFVEACDAELRERRREGWPMNSLVRRLALEGEASVAAAALRYAATSAATLAVVAAALEDAQRVELALAALECAPEPVDGSAALVRALERLSGSGAGGRRRALRLLVRQPGPRAQAALGRLLQRAQDRLARAGRGSEHVRQLAAYLELVDELPADRALPSLLVVGQQPDVRAAARARFLARVRDDVPAALSVLRDALNQPRSRPLALEWGMACQLPELVPLWLAGLEADPDDEALLAALLAQADEQVAAGLFDLWAEERHGRHEAQLRRGLLGVLSRTPAMIPALGSRTRLAQVEDLVQLAGLLAPSRRGALLLACLEAHDPAADPAGHGAALLTALGRLGTVDDGRRLLDWVAGRSSTDRLLPLAWATAACLAGTDALALWQHAGRDPRLLRGVSETASARFEARVQPSAGVLAPVRRSLLRESSEPQTSSL